MSSWPWGHLVLDIVSWQYYVSEICVKVLWKHVITKQFERYIIYYNLVVNIADNNIADNSIAVM